MIIKKNVKDIDGVRFENLEYGDCFEYGGFYYIKIRGSKNAAGLDDGECFHFYGNETCHLNVLGIEIM